MFLPLVLSIRMADIKDMFHRCFCIIICRIIHVLPKYILEYSMTFFCISLHQMRRPLACYAFINIKLALYHLLLYLVFMCQESLNFIDAFNCYKQE